MIRTVNIYSTSKNKLKQLIVKFCGFGKNDVQTAFAVAPYGVDSNPIKDMVAVYAPTADKGTQVIIGYINKNSLAQPGEVRHFSTDANGNEKFYTWLKNDGTLELNGNTNNLVKFTELNAQLQSLVNNLNSQLALIQSGIASAGGTYPRSELTLNINSAKTTKIKIE